MTRYEVKGKRNGKASKDQPHTVTIEAYNEVHARVVASEHLHKIESVKRLDK